MSRPYLLAQHAIRLCTIRKLIPNIRPRVRLRVYSCHASAPGLALIRDFAFGVQGAVPDRPGSGQGEKMT
jgi:hypothetical protein